MSYGECFGGTHFYGGWDTNPYCQCGRNMNRAYWHKTWQRRMRLRWAQAKARLNRRFG